MPNIKIKNVAKGTIKTIDKTAIISGDVYKRQQSPQKFKGGTIWNVIVNIHGAVQAIGLALLVLFFVVGIVKTCGSFAEVRKPEHALKLFIRFAIAKGVVTYGLELMLALFNIVQGLV